MDCYKVLLVDDEEDVRNMIVRKLDWAALGFRVIGEAGNGQEALELAERLAPDVIMTDIKMPFMDGLELCRRVKLQLPGVRLAVFSGFDEFEYAKEAITQQVEEYILKPINAGELTGVFQRLRESLDREIAQRRDMERLRAYYEESLPMMRQQLLYSLLDGSAPSLDKLLEYGLDISADSYCVAVLRYEQEEGGEPHLLALSLEQLVEDTLAGTVDYRLLRMPDRLVMLFLLGEGEEAKWVAGLLNQLFPASKRLLGISVTIGVGTARSKPEEIPQSYQEAARAPEYQLLVGPGQSIFIGDIEPGAAGDEMPDPSYADEVVRQVKIGSEEDLGKAVDAMIRHLKEVQTGAQQYNIYLLDLLTGLLKLIRTYQLDPVEAGQEKLLVDGVSLRFSNMDEMGRWLFACCDNLRVLARRERKDSVRLLIDRAKQILAEEYADCELSLDAVCARLNVSPAYFSTLFKKDTGQGFVGYLTDLRMDKALELLTATGDKTYQIAEKTGYADPNYFSYVFKKKFGVSPSKYKADRVNQDGSAKDSEK